MPQTPSFFIPRRLLLYNLLAGQRLSLRSGAASATQPGEPGLRACSPSADGRRRFGSVRRFAVHTTFGHGHVCWTGRGGFPAAAGHQADGRSAHRLPRMAGCLGDSGSPRGEKPDPLPLRVDLSNRNFTLDGPRGAAHPQTLSAPPPSLTSRSSPAASSKSSSDVIR